uniref:C2H2-type domain-containing protein n=1 Tax=Athene cunicularia TaxID=194338 RepID=A0A663M5H5_ATHCN
MAGGEGLLICGICGLTFEAEAGLSAHWDEHHRLAPYYQCGACGKAFRHRRSLLTHKKHRGRHQHACTECCRTFCLKGDLLRHRASHGGEGGYVCPLCGDSFRHKRGLQAHGKEHADQPCHKCPQCEKCFEDEASLNRHQAAHCEERPFLCGRCGRSFSWKESLIIHQRSHAQERSHKCPDCGRGFSRSGNLLMHQRVHTGERPFACPQCDKAFCSKANLITHKKLHRRYKIFTCSHCRMGFSSKSKLLLHQRGTSRTRQPCALHPFGPQCPPTLGTFPILPSDHRPDSLLQVYWTLPGAGQVKLGWGRRGGCPISTPSGCTLVKPSCEPSLGPRFAWSSAGGLDGCPGSLPAEILLLFPLPPSLPLFLFSLLLFYYVLCCATLFCSLLITASKVSCIGEGLQQSALILG